MKIDRNPEREWFGERKVEANEKTRLVHNVFESVSDKYDLMNDIMSGGVHRLWKNRLVREIRPRKNLAYLDVAGGTGDIAFRIHKAVPEANITVCDLSEDMIQIGKNRALNKGILSGFQWITGNAENLPFEDNSFDIYTISFGLRNVTRIDTALAEAYRVLKSGGRFYCLEFSNVEEPLLAKLYDRYSFSLIPRIGHIVAKDSESYKYLVESIRKFPDQRRLEHRLKSAGFGRAWYINLTFGVAAIHKAWKL